MSENMIGWIQDPDGIVVLTMNDPAQGANTMNQRYKQSMGATVDRLEDERDSITGVVLTSAKPSFFAGGDLNSLLTATPADAQRVFDEVQKIKAQLRRLERLGRPVVAAINGAALGGGLEIALATHRRVAANLPGVLLGLPEVSLGLMPGAGGVTRITRLLGIQRGFTTVLAQNTRFDPVEALNLGLVDELVDSIDALVPAAKEWIKAHPEAHVAPWNLEGYTIPGGIPSSPEFAAILPVLPSNLRKQVKGAPTSAPRAILAAAVEGTQVDFDHASTIESRYFTELACGSVSTNMIQAFFFDLQAIGAGASRPDGIARTTFKKAAVLGAGMMGSAIAYLCAKAGIEVMLKDVTIQSALRGKEHATQIEARALTRATTQEKSDALLARIRATADVKDLADADLVIEAVFESEDLKQRVFQEIEDVVHPTALLGSNTSTLPITNLARGVKRQQDFIGIHFFSPAEKMPLVEIIRGERTSDSALAKAFDLVQTLGKTPIVVNDSRGFFTSRVISTFLYEALGMLAEGVEPATIEQAALQAGYPAGPLQLLDELTLTLMQKIRNETHAAIRATGGTPPDDRAGAVLDTMVDELERPSKANGAGFYDYVDGKRTRLWPGLRDTFGTGTSPAPPFGDLMERLLFIEAIETQKCFDEDVLSTTADANIGSIYGIGYPAWTGGVHQYVVGYKGGLAGFVDRADELAKRYGERFDVPNSLRGAR